MRIFDMDYNIHNSYEEFFRDQAIISELDNIWSQIKDKQYNPLRQNIFKSLESDLLKVKVLILGMDPYPQLTKENIPVATGLAFEVLQPSWDSKEVNASLKNIMKLIYKSYFQNEKNTPLEKIRMDISSNKFNILPPESLFKQWQNNGVLLLNTALTVELDTPGTHISIWNNFNLKLLTYIFSKNSEIISFIWGKNAEKFSSYCKGEKYISTHPAMSGGPSPNDFMNSKCFWDTFKYINWLTGERK